MHYIVALAAWMHSYDLVVVSAFFFLFYIFIFNYMLC